MNVSQPISTRLITNIEISADPSLRIPLPPYIHEFSSLLVAPKFGSSHLEIAVAEIGTLRVPLNVFHYVRHPCLTPSIVFLFLPDRVQSEVMICLHAEGHIGELPSTAWIHGIPQCERLLGGQSC